ncbi:MAG: hypothetical protein H0T76_28180 [Nannocystis sp.]|nr:hypothetical protein [Nannocystis sp.]
MADIDAVRALRSEGVEALAQRLALQTRRHREHPQLVLLKYSMIDSPMADPVVRQCRGIVVDEADDFRPIAYPYDKFFNAHEGHAAPIDWSSARLYEKIDGTLCTLYSYRGVWHVASASLPDAQGVLRHCKRSIAEAFWDVFRARGYRLPDRSDHCFMFELCVPSDPMLIRYEEARLLLHGARDMVSLREAEPEPFAAAYGWELVSTHPVTDLAAARARPRPRPPRGAGRPRRRVQPRQDQVARVRRAAPHARRDQPAPPARGRAHQRERRVPRLLPGRAPRLGGRARPLPGAAQRGRGDARARPRHPRRSDLRPVRARPALQQHAVRGPQGPRAVDRRGLRGHVVAEPGEAAAPRRARQAARRAGVAARPRSGRRRLTRVRCSARASRAPEQNGRHG